MSTSQGHIAIVDDDPEIQRYLRRLLNVEGHQVSSYLSGVQAISAIENSQENRVDLVLLDINMPEINGLTLIKKLKELAPEIPVIIITAFGSIESAVEAIKNNAYDYLTKPLKTTHLLAAVNRAMEFRRLERENAFLRQELRNNWALGDMIGKSYQMQLIFDLIKKAGPANANVLILGETGSGKEMVARAIHQAGPRRSRPFLTLNCTTIPEVILTSEMFGSSTTTGLLEEADGGTVFLDEVGHLDLTVQTKLLKFLENPKLFSKTPSSRRRFNREIDVRFIAASHHDLKNAIVLNRFREDLYLRLGVVPILIPPLRERPEDIPLFAEFFLRKYTRNDASPKTLSKEAIAKLIGLPWESNVRQLENAMERAVILADGDVIRPEHISPVQIPTRAEPMDFQNLGVLSFKEMERRCLEHALQKAGGKKERAAQILGISRKTLYRKEKEYGLT